MSTNLFVEIEMGKRQFNSFPDFLFLHVQSSHIGIGDVRFLVCTEHCDRRIGFRRKDVNKGIGVAVKSNGGGGFELFAIESGKYSDDIIRAC